MSLEQRIADDYKRALKEKDRGRVDFISYLRAELKNYAIAKRAESLSDEDAVTVLRKKVKQLGEMLGQAKKAGRNELIEATEREIDIIQGYLPEQMPVEQVEEIVAKIVAEQGLCSVKDMGRAIKEARAVIGLRAEGKAISDAARKFLGNG